MKLLHHAQNMNMVAVDVPFNKNSLLSTKAMTQSLLPLHCNSHCLATRIIVGYAVYDTCVDLILCPSPHHCIGPGPSFNHQFANSLPSGFPWAIYLRYVGQSNTLTCTSTGGPATTVTWRRDGAVITLNATHQQTKRVVDPVMGTYQTVLTIDPSVSQSDIVGTYSCTVGNARGKSSRIVVISGNGELILCACTIGYASFVKQHPSLKKCPTPTIFMHFLLCYVHYMYLPTDYQHLVILSPHILERAPNPYNVLSNFTQMSIHPGTSFTQLIHCTHEL